VSLFAYVLNYTFIIPFFSSNLIGACLNYSISTVLFNYYLDNCLISGKLDKFFFSFNAILFFNVHSLQISMLILLLITLNLDLNTLVLCRSSPSLLIYQVIRMELILFCLLLSYEQLYNDQEQD
jgi:hypothetical protein